MRISGLFGDTDEVRQVGQTSLLSGVGIDGQAIRPAENPMGVSMVVGNP